MIGRVVGENLRRLRKARGLTQDELARALQPYGLEWQRSHIAAFEAGNRDSIELDTGIALARALNVQLTDLLAGDGDVSLRNAVLSRPGCRETLAEPAPRWTETIGLSEHGTRAFIRQSAQGETVPFQADAELAQRLGVRPDDVIAVAEQEWGRTLHQERDRRAAELGDLSAAERRARRGHITRQLSTEIERLLFEQHVINPPEKEDPE